MGLEDVSSECDENNRSYQHIEVTETARRVSMAGSLGGHAAGRESYKIRKEKEYQENTSWVRKMYDSLCKRIRKYFPKDGYKGLP